MDKDKTPLNDEALESVAGGAQDSFKGVPLYDWTRFAVAITRGLNPGERLAICYSPGGAVNHNAGVWQNGEQVRIHPYYTMNGKDAVWRWGHKNGFYGWINGRYLA